MKYIIAAMFAIAFSAPSLAENLVDVSACASIKSSEKRLECYDSAAKETTQNGKSGKQVRHTNKEQKVAKKAAKETYTAVKKFQVQLDTGISYSAYSPALSEAKFSVSQFADSKEATILPEFTSHLQRAMTHYDTANSIWKMKFYESTGRSEFIQKPDLVEALKEMYPEIKPEEKEGPLKGWVYIDSVITIIWKSAAKEIDLAKKSGAL